MLNLLLESPSLLRFSIPSTVREDIQLSEEKIECEADFGFNDGGQKQLTVEYKLPGESNFQPFILGEMERETSDGPCRRNETVSYSRMSFSRHFNSSELRCSLYEISNNSSSLRIGSPSLTLYILSSEYSIHLIIITSI